MVKTVSLVWMGFGLVSLVLMGLFQLSAMAMAPMLEECRTRGLEIGSEHWSRRIRLHGLLAKLFAVMLAAAIGGMVSTW